MKLEELSRDYADSAARLQARIDALRALRRQTEDPEERQALQRRINALLPMWRESRDLARLTGRYYGERH